MQYDVNNFDFICVSGYGRTGSSACIDLLKEFEFVGGPNKEFRIAKDPNGLIDLESSLIDNWELIRHNTAINDFLEYCSMLSRKDGTLKKAGKNFSQILNVDFTKESAEYIERITDFMYLGDTMISRYHLNALQSFKQRLRSKFDLSNTTPMYFSHPDEEKFLIETRRYLKRLFENYAVNKNIHKVVLNQAIPPTNINKALKYFNNGKLIIIDRDPRDIYATMLKEGSFLGADVISNDSVHKYIKWHRYTRKQVAHGTDSTFMQDKVLRLNLEDLFLNYNETIGRIKEFLDIDFAHVDKGNKFKHKSTNDCVGIWRGVLDQGTTLQIEKELGEYCYNAL